MANKNFSDFDSRFTVLSTDYIVGYKEEGPLEIKINVNDLFNFARVPYISFNNSFAKGQGSLAINNSEAAGAFSFSTNVGAASGDYSVATGTGRTSGSFSFARGVGTYAAGDVSDASGFGSFARANFSIAQGYNSRAVHQYSYIWSDGTLGTQVNGVSTTRTGQYRVDATGGVYITGNVGINTDNINNALTVNGNLSATSIDVVGNLESDSLQVADNVVVGNEISVPIIFSDNIDTTNIVAEKIDSTLLEGPSGTAVIHAPCTLSALNFDITYLTAKSNVPVLGTKSQTGLFLTIFVGTSTLYIPLFK